MSKRLLFLEKATRDGSTDPMAWYGLAMEYKALGRHDEALAAFTTLRERSPDYVAMYLMCGTMLAGLSRRDEARGWLEAGVEVAARARNAHAEGELRTALDELDDCDT
jgi:predicted Zn-dependent protease